MEDSSIKCAIHKSVFLIRFWWNLVKCGAHVYYNFTNFHQNWMKNKKVLLIAHFSVQNFKVSVELWKSYIVGWCNIIFFRLQIPGGPRIGRNNGRQKTWNNFWQSDVLFVSQKLFLKFRDKNIWKISKSFSIFCPLCDSNTFLKPKP